MSRFFVVVFTIVVIAFTFGSVANLPAQDSDSCNGERSHEFDFWIGDWTVYGGDEVAGENSIQSILDGCVLHESWRGARGSAGSSFNFYNPQTEKWQQFWVWRNGTTLELEGEYENGKMVLEGESVTQSGETVFNRITWYDNDDGTVRQHWEYTKDDGNSYETLFDGLYKKK